MKFPRHISGAGALSRAKRGGFTLIELLVILVIISVLAGLLIPAASSLLRKAAAPGCMANLRTYGAGVFTMVADYGGAPQDTGGKLPGTDWSKDLKGYVPDDLHCPLRPKNFHGLGFTYGSPRFLTTFFPKVQLAGIPDASKVVVGSEMYFRGEGFYTPTHIWRTLYGCAGASRPMLEDLEADEGKQRPPQYHGDVAHRGMHVMFLDGHIELCRIEVDDGGRLKYPMEDKYWDNNDFGPNRLSKGRTKK